MTLVLGSVLLTQATNKLAQVSVATARRPLAVVGPAPAGAQNTPKGFSNKAALLAEHSYGPMAEAAAYALAYEVPRVVCVRTQVSDEVAGSYGSITEDSVGGSVSGDGTIKPGGEYEVVVAVTTGFVVGVAGGYYKYSLDGGRKFSSPVALGTAAFIQLPYGGGKYTLTAAQAWLPGESFSLQTTAPRWTSAGITAAIESLRDSTIPFGAIEILGPIATTGEIDAIHAAVLDMRAKIKYVRATGHFRSKTAAETSSAYRAALLTLVGAADKDLLCVTPSWYAPSVINPGAEYVAPFSWAVAPRTVRVNEDVSANSIVQFGALSGSIRDSADQVRARTVDDFYEGGAYTGMRVVAPRTWPHKGASVYVGAGATLAADGSDTQLMRVAQILDLACETAYPPLADRVGVGQLPGPDGIHLDKDEKKRVEGIVSTHLAQALVDTKKAKTARFIIDPDQVVVGVPPIVITGKALIGIKGYPDEFAVEVGVNITGSAAA